MQGQSEHRVGYAAWLREFLGQRGLRAPDQRPLYAYHCTREEYAQLREFLRIQGASQRLLGDTAAAACFVLAGAEWYRRDHRRTDGWSWDPVFAALGVRLVPQELAKVVPKGLESGWRRPLHRFESSHRDFLGSVFGEGGLPSQLLQEAGGKFQLLFDRLLRRYEDAHLMGISAVQQVQDALAKTNFAQVFASADSTALIAEMVERLVALVRDYGLDEAPDPVAKINALNPKWRELFPLPLDDTTGSKLLTGLLKTATDEGSKRRKGIGGWKCVHFWDERHPDALVARVTVPGLVNLRLTIPPTSTRFELALAEGEQVIAPMGAGYAQILDDGLAARVRVRTTEVVARRRRCDAPLSLLVLIGGAPVASLPIPGSTVALDEAPVGFEPVADRWQLCGQATFSATGTEVLLALPANSKLVVPDQPGTIELEEGPSICNLHTVSVRGKGDVRVEAGDAYRIRLGRGQPGEVGIDLTGQTVHWPTVPPLTFIGLPTPHLPGGGDALQQRGVALYVGSRRAGSGLPQEGLGAQFASLRNADGVTLVRHKIGVLPSDFRIKQEPGDSAATGRIKIYTRTPCLIQVLTTDVHAQRTRRDDGVQLVLEATGTPPATVRIAATPNLEADPVLIDLPFPSLGWLGFDRDGAPLPRELSIDDLVGARLHLFAPGESVANFTLELTLKGGLGKSVYYRWQYRVRGAPIGVQLYSLREQILDLLSLRPDVDQKVELRVSDNRHDDYFQIGRYAAYLQYDSAQQRVIGGRVSRSDEGSPAPRMMLLHEPKQQAVSLQPCTSEGVPTGDFVVPSQIGTDGPWLVVPPPQTPMSFRPLYIPGNTPLDLLEGEAHSLEKASAQFNPSTAPNVFALVLSEMAGNPNHSGWEFLNRLYESYGQLPLPTFKVWQALVLGPADAMAMALLKFEAEPAFLARIEREFPLLWEFFPLPALRDAARAFRSFLQSGGLNEAVAKGIVARILRRVAESIPIGDGAVQQFLIGDPISDRWADVLPPPVLEAWHQDLLRDCGDAEWPTYGSEELATWVRGYALEDGLFAVQAQHRRAVVYLPVFAAAVAAGVAKMTDVFPSNAESVFALHKVREFDRTWFDAMYQYHLSRILATARN